MHAPFVDSRAPARTLARTLRRRAFAASGLLHAIGLGIAGLSTIPLLATVNWAGSQAAPLQSSIVFAAPRLLERTDPPPDLQVAVEESPAEPQLTAPVEPLETGPWPATAKDSPVDDTANRREPNPVAWRTPLRKPPTASTPPPPAPVETLAEVQPDPRPSEASATVEPSPIPGCNPAPVYPFVPWRRGIEGTVVVQLVIDTTGAVTDATVATSSGNAQLDAAAVAKLRTWRFAPARTALGPVTCVHQQAVVFQIRG